MIENKSLRSKIFDILNIVILIAIMKLLPMLFRQFL